MLRLTAGLLRRGKPRPRAGMFPEKYRRVPEALKPQQGGQQYFSEFLLRTADEEMRMRQRESATHGGMQAASTAAAATSLPGVMPKLPRMDVDNMLHYATAAHTHAAMERVMQSDAFQTSRGFNERQWLDEETARMRGAETSAEESTAATATDTPERVLGADYFKSRYGYSLVKELAVPEEAPATDYAQLDLWGEMPKYQRDMIFLYLISRRRNTFAVAYDYDGKRLLNTYTAGNRGLKGGDRGFRGDGSTDNGHQVTSMYLNDLLPKIRELRAAQGRPLAKGEKINLVVRVMGFYNGRQGAVRAVQDRGNEFVVRYLEDITPFPLNGPKMPRGVFH